MTRPNGCSLAKCAGPCVLVVVLGFGKGSLADESVVHVIGGVAIPADCPMARNEHPRLLFTRTQLPAIKARLNQSPLKEDFQLLKDTLDDGLRRGTERARTAIVPLGVVYHLTGDQRYGRGLQASGASSMANSASTLRWGCTVTTSSMT